MGGGADDLLARQASQPAYSLVQEGGELVGLDPVGLRPRVAQLGGFRIESKRAVEGARSEASLSIGAAPDLLHDGVAVQLLVAQSHRDVKHRRGKGQVALRSFGCSCTIAHARLPRGLLLRIVSLRVYPQWYYSEVRSSAQRDLHALG